MNHVTADFGVNEIEGASAKHCQALKLTSQRNPETPPGHACQRQPGHPELNPLPPRPRPTTPRRGDNRGRTHPPRPRAPQGRNTGGGCSHGPQLAPSPKRPTPPRRTRPAGAPPAGPPRAHQPTTPLRGTAATTTGHESSRDYPEPQGSGSIGDEMPHAEAPQAGSDPAIPPEHTRARRGCTRHRPPPAPGPSGPTPRGNLRCGSPIKDGPRPRGPGAGPPAGPPPPTPPMAGQSRDVSPHS